MHDMKAIRANPDAFDAAMQRRGQNGAAATLQQIDTDLRGALTREQEHQQRRNELAKLIPQLKRDGCDATAAQREATDLKQHIADCAAAASSSQDQLNAILPGLPNILDDTVPDGTDETHNVTLTTWGTPRTFAFPARQHFELGESLALMDFPAAARVAGARFTVLRGPLARLERALGQFMLDLHTTEHGYTETAVPGLVQATALYGTGQLPKFEDDLFRTTDNRYLIPTAEVPLTNLTAGEILPAAALPLRLTALTDCYRSEAGSAGRDTRGMLRQHQFRKVELVAITHPDASDAEHERMTRAAETVLERLDLPYRRMLLCAGDTGFSAAKTHDLEVWLPGQGMWREISSISTCRTFQARRMNTRYRGPDGKVAGFVHTLNGSGIAVGRALIAVMENYQQADGSIVVPDALRGYMGGQASINAV